MSVGIIGIAAALPSRELDDTELERRFDPKELRSISKMSGITRRRVVAPGQCASDLALTAAERLLAAKGFDRSQIDLLIFVSQTPDYRIPTTASVLHGKLKLAETCATFDINQACSAYPYALSVAYSMIMSSVAHYALVLNADALTTLIHPEDRALIPLHGDAACATLLGPCPEGYGFEGFALGTDGSGAKYLIVPEGAGRKGLGTNRETYAHPEHIFMDGPAVFHFSVSRIPLAMKKAIADQGLTVEQIDHFILHQANKTMMGLIYRSVRVPKEKQFYFLEGTGNSSGPATAVAVAEAWRTGFIRPGSRTMMCSFGAGLTWGIAFHRWPEDADPSVPLDPVIPDHELLDASL
jgi:3-oxoacyl-[acyl-carrier-protein] synthase-3